MADAATPNAVTVSSRGTRLAARRPLLAFAVAASVTVDAALAAVSGHFPDWPTTALLGLALGQTIAAATWLVLGSGYPFARCTTLPLAAMLLSQMLAPHVKPSAAQMLGVLLAVGAAVAVPLGLARAAGLRIAACDAPAPARDSCRTSRRYSLASLFALMTVVAVFAAVVRQTAFPGEQWITAAIHCLGFAAAAIVPLAMFADGLRGDIRLWLIAAMVLGAACGAMFGPICRVAAVEACLLLTVACLLLDCGYRVDWPAAKIEPA
jgi:hypothetical protein